ncbi:ParB N-terminal domain-containing protein [Priestia megaterium]|uniref:ParB N-terminal domain-containing protein n=1 Tax=Priestia megaterium TaxID=1404 RepID=UPI00076278FA|nr:ParB N-terminal domain-containing protein [Priestia megaterium]KWU60978.1 hypothetical protein AWX17_19320 [Priestia megaterium]
MNNVITDLKLINTDSLFLHEPTEQLRLDKISILIEKEGIIRNPLMATPLEDEKYLILDGAHRTAALKKLGCRRVPVQVVQPAQFQLFSWDHIVPLGDWLQQLYNIPNLKWSSEEPAGDSLMATSVSANGTVHYAFADFIHTEEEKLDIWCQLVESYSQQHSVKRLPHRECLYPEEDFILLQYPAYTLDALKRRVLNKKTFPSGVTRFLINGRLLNLSIPLDILISETANKKEWNQLLERFESKIRLYSESVYFCEA